ncbi:ciliogenesis and planar polarity effector 2-like [Schistocerca nitens]|uniref:ciliogenesis and planar polarity effector 2-like n=1 Tax=Schistocerca nitens TaxID=7011 RepID=UPI0021187ABC|nr:ciliogenesis and planar polarity effector 2-like [Schistocerca nitens]
MNLSVGNIISLDWHSSAEGETMLQHFYNPQTTGRKTFGILERPSIASNVEEVSYKLFVTGKSGIGKTATVARLAGSRCRIPHTETHGIQKSNIFWPVKIWDKIILFKLQIWDAGENAIKKYAHIFPACRDKADAIVYIFSFTDPNSLAELPQQMARTALQGENPACIAIGTRYSVQERGETLSTEIKDFEQKWQVPVLRIDNRWAGDRGEVHEVAPILNIICERLWVRDQEYLLKQGISK